MAEPIKINGRSFEKLDKTTLQHDICTQAQIQRCGLHRLELLPVETAEDYALRVFRTACMNGDVLALIGHLLLADGLNYKQWTPKHAAEIATFFGALDDEQDKLQVRALLVAALMDFLTAGLAYAVRSLSAGASQAQESGEALPSATAA